MKINRETARKKNIEKSLNSPSSLVVIRNFGLIKVVSRLKRNRAIGNGWWAVNDSLIFSSRKTYPLVLKARKSFESRKVTNWTFFASPIKFVFDSISQSEVAPREKRGWMVDIRAIINFRELFSGMWRRFEVNWNLCESFIWVIRGRPYQLNNMNVGIHSNFCRASHWRELLNSFNSICTRSLGSP